LKSLFLSYRKQIVSLLKNVNECCVGK